ncbi:hypothetical protein D4R78_06220 [bacterium]|nr:MAG: hypothetical protein D4R78_06220 [bacterium]
MRNNNSPEEKLLKLIRGQKSQQEDIPLIKPEEEDPVVASVYEKKRSFKPILRPRDLIKYLGLSYIKKAVILLLVFSLLYAVLSLLYPLFGLKKIRMPKPLPIDISENKRIIKEETRPYEAYLGEIKKRNIFLNKGMAGESNINMAVASSDLVKNFNLIGIIAGSIPQAIIEDKINNKVYYLNKGQYIREFQVADILDGKIILNYEGQNYELYL